MTLLLAWNDDYGMLPDRVDDCAHPVRITRDRNRIDEAAAVIFHIPSLRDPLERLTKRPGQRWVAWSMESDANYPVLTFPPFLRHFDLTMTYRRDSDVWVPYLTGELLTPASLVPPWTQPDPGAGAPAVYVASNPTSLSRRDDYVRQLMEHLPVDSYGTCLNNRAWPADDEGRATKLATIGRYPFTLAFENSVADDYVTEKFFDAFVAGSVPVYLGARNVADFAPGEHSFVDVHDFDGPRALASFLLGLLAEPSRYEEYHAWRSGGVRPGYQDMVGNLAAHPLCRLAALLT